MAAPCAPVTAAYSSLGGGSQAAIDCWKGLPMGQVAQMLS
jgi:hypothetical protein